MRVSERMQRDVVRVTPQTTVPEAFALLRKRSIRHLPVEENGKLVGIVTDHDFRGVLETEEEHVFCLPRNMTVSEIMTEELIVVDPDLSVDDAARIMLRNRIHGLPVVEDDQMVGIITDTDLLEIFVELLGLLTESCRVDVALGPNRENVEKVIAAINSIDREVISVSWNNRYEYAGKGVFSFRIKGEDPEPIAAALERAGFDVIG